MKCYEAKSSPLTTGLLETDTVRRSLEVIKIHK